ncbi:MAG: sarcosine oxidase subunit gamma [Gammaproteobacteria bacterium]|nr:sarcosine oxidase subunit gamma [Gammaproteobacteria bacterium]
MADFDNTDAMPATPTPTSPAAGRAPVDGETRLRELPCCGKINLRGDPGDENFTRAAAEALGVGLPLAPNTVATDARVTVFWLGPDEWLIHLPLNDTESQLQQLRQHLAPFHHAATEVTDYYTALELRGKHAAEVLARGCPLDLHPRAFPPGACAQSRFGNASVLLYQPAQLDEGCVAGDHDDDNANDSARFLIQVRWSFTDYVWDYLATVIDALAD